MTTLVYTSARGKHIAFDDWENAYTWDDDMNDVPLVWTRMCASCHKKYRGILGNRCDCGGSGSGACSVKGCEQMAEYYVDFSVDEVKEENTEDVPSYIGRKGVHEW